MLQRGFQLLPCGAVFAPEPGGDAARVRRPHRRPGGWQVVGDERLVFAHEQLDVLRGTDDRPVGRRDLDRIEHPGPVLELAEDRHAVGSELVDAHGDAAAQPDHAGGEQGAGAHRRRARAPRPGRR